MDALVKTIKTQREYVDLLSRVCENIISFEPYHWEIPDAQLPRQEFGNTDVRQVPVSESSSTASLKHHWIIRTDRGTFRYASSDEDFWDKISPNFDLKSRKVNNAIDSLKMGKAWSGKVLGSLGTENSYKNDGNRKSEEDIEEEADTYDIDDPVIVSMEPWGEGNMGIIEKSDSGGYGSVSEVAKVDFMREEIKKVIDTLSNFYPNDGENGTVSADFQLTASIQHLSEARFWLGFELGRMRGEKK